MAAMHDAPYATRHALAAIAWRSGRPAPGDECVAEERAVALEVNGIAHAVMLATPADLEDFALGFCLTEGLIDSASDLLDAESAPAGEDGVALRLTVTQRCLARFKERRRSLAGRTGCGLCGTESIEEALRPVRRDGARPGVTAGALALGMRALGGDALVLQRATGATHAAAWIRLDGTLALVREDVGRHNALDKLVGAMARAGTDPAGGFVAVTSRASHEMVQKTAAAGAGILAAISAPTALAVRTARRGGLVLVGFARDDRATVYAGTERVAA